MSTFSEVDEQFCKLLRDYLFPPGVEALAPINPRKLGGYVAGSVLSSDLSISVDLVSKPLENVGVALNYMRDGHNASHVVRRVAQVSMDTLRINLMAEGVPVVGPALAGQYANEAAQKYADQMVTDYKLVDSVKQACLKRRWMKRYGNATMKATAWRGAPGGNYSNSSTYYTQPGSYGPRPGSGPIDTAAINGTGHRFRWIKRFRGGGQETMCKNIGLKVQLFMIRFYKCLMENKTLIILGFCYFLYSRFVYKQIVSQCPLFGTKKVKVAYG